VPGCTASPPARAVAWHVALQHRLLVPMGPLCSGCPRPAYTASFRASPRARLHHPLTRAAWSHTLCAVRALCSRAPPAVRTWPLPAHVTPPALARSRVPPGTAGALFHPCACLLRLPFPLWCRSPGPLLLCRAGARSCACSLASTPLPNRTARCARPKPLPVPARRQPTLARRLLRAACSRKPPSARLRSPGPAAPCACAEPPSTGPLPLLCCATLRFARAPARPSASHWPSPRRCH
jgi:hypothetical protein